ARDLLGTRILESYRIQDAGRRLGEPVLRIAWTRVWRRVLVHDRAEPSDVDELRVLDALTEGPGGGQHRILESQTTRRVHREVDAVFRQRLRWRLRNGADLGDHRAREGLAQ